MRDRNRRARFVGGTLRADGHLAGQEATPQRETGEQIKVVRAGAMGLITSSDEGTLHARTRGVIEAAMARPRDGHLVVVTHHAPHPTCLQPAHCSGWTAGNAASDLSQLTDGGQAKLWGAWPRPWDD